MWRTRTARWGSQASPGHGGGVVVAFHAVIEMLAGLPENVVGVEGVGEVSSDDYRNVLIPATETALEKSGRINLLYVLGERFDGLSGGAVWEDTKLGLEHFRRWDRMAVVTDVEWIGHALKAVGWMVPAKIRIFPTSERATAEEWVTGEGSPS